MARSQDLRDRVIDAVKLEGMTCGKAARRFNVSVSSAIRWMRRFRETGERTPLRAGGCRPSKIAPHRDFPEKLRTDRPDMTPAEMCRRLRDGCGVSVRPRSMSRFLRREGVACKKTLVAGERNSPKTQRFRRRWRKYQGSASVGRLIFMDETCFKTNMTSLYGWGNCGERVIGEAPANRETPFTFVAGLRCDGVHAPFPFKGAMNGEALCVYAGEILAKDLKPGDVVVLDNPGRRKNREFRRIVEATGARLFFLPTYSPDPNSIEQAFAKLETLLSKAEARSFDAVCDAIRDILETFTPEECANYFRNSGYGSY